jgi:hypothetical protein
MHPLHLPVKLSYDVQFVTNTTEEQIKLVGLEKYSPNGHLNS